MMSTAGLEDALDRGCTRVRDRERVNVVDGLFAIADALDRCAGAIHKLGNADAMTPMGGLEALGVALSESLDRIAYATEETRT